MQAVVQMLPQASEITTVRNSGRQAVLGLCSLLPGADRHSFFDVHVDIHGLHYSKNLVFHVCMTPPLI